MAASGSMCFVLDEDRLQQASGRPLAHPPTPPRTDELGRFHLSLGQGPRLPAPWPPWPPWDGKTITAGERCVLYLPFHPAFAD